MSTQVDLMVGAVYLSVGGFLFECISLDSGDPHNAGYHRIRILSLTPILGIGPGNEFYYSKTREGVTLPFWVKKGVRR